MDYISIFILFEKDCEVFFSRPMYSRQSCSQATANIHQPEGKAVAFAWEVKHGANKVHETLTAAFKA